MTDRIDIYRDSAGEWRWRRTHPNGNILSQSSEGYRRRIDCVGQAWKLNADIDALTIHHVGIDGDAGTAEAIERPGGGV